LKTNPHRKDVAAQAAMLRRVFAVRQGRNTTDSPDRRARDACDATRARSATSQPQNCSGSSTRGYTPYEQTLTRATSTKNPRAQTPASRC